MLIQDKANKIIFFLLSTLPISIIIGSSISLINIVLLSLIILVIIYYERDVGFIKYSPVKLILSLYLYLIFNSIISQDYSVGIERNFGFIRFILLFICINYFFFKYQNANHVFYFWIICIILVTFDSHIEFFLGQNILGWGGIDQPHGSRIVSFFKDEPIVGAYLSAFILIIFGFLLTKYKHNNVFPWLFIIVTFSGILISGERSNTIKIFLSLTLMFLFFNFINTKKKITIISLIILLFVFLLNTSNYLKTRYLKQFISNFLSKEKFENFSKNSDYFQLYRSGISVFMNYPIFGVGNKNYRVETCSEEVKNNKNYYCLTHPHQIYIEFLSEHGLIGSLIILGIFFSLMFKILLNILKSKNYIQIGTFCYVLFVFTPLLPSGSFFSDLNSTLLWLNISLMFACCKKTNIFNYKV